MTKKIPIVLAVDKLCASQLYTTINSAILNKNPETFYDFYCLIPSKFSKFVFDKFQKLEKKHRNIKINFKTMGKAFSGIKMQLSHITTPTYYRLMMADLLPMYEKAIWLDIDTIILIDLTELFNIDLENNYVAGVKAAGCSHDYIIGKTRDYYDSIGLKMDSYINAGVMIWNLEKIRKDGKTKTLLKMSETPYMMMDQDIINLAFYGKIKLLDFKYNMMVLCKTRFFDIPEMQTFIENFYGKESLKNAIKNPAIIHYAAHTKPWNDKTLWLAEKWLYYAKKTPLKIKRTKTKTQKFCELVNSKKTQKLVFWGASLLLENIFKEKKIKHTKILGIIDKNPLKQGQYIDKYEIFPPEKLKKLSPEIVISAIMHNNKKIYPQIKEYITKTCPKTKLLQDVFEE